MSDVKPFTREVIIQKPMREVYANVKLALNKLKGSINRDDQHAIEAEFGSLLLSRIIGELWVPKSVLPKKATITISAIDNNTTKFNITIIDTHKYGILWGCVDKYENALAELASGILEAVDSNEQAVKSRSE